MFTFKVFKSVTKFGFRVSNVARKVVKYGAFPDSYSSVFGLNMGKYGPEKTPYLSTSHTEPLAIFTTAK